MSFHDLERLEDWPLFEELTVVLRALPVVAATDILGRKMSAARPTPAAWCRRIRVDRSCQLVMATVADVAKSVEMAVLRLDESEPRVPEDWAQFRPFSVRARRSKLRSSRPLSPSFGRRW